MLTNFMMVIDSQYNYILHISRGVASLQVMEGHIHFGLMHKQIFNDCKNKQLMTHDGLANIQCSKNLYNKLYITLSPITQVNIKLLNRWIRMSRQIISTQVVDLI